EVRVDRAVVPVEVLLGIGIEVVAGGQGAGGELVLRQLPGVVVHRVEGDHAEERILRHAPAGSVGRRGRAHEVDRPVGELAGEVPFAVYLAAVIVHRADAVHGLVLLPQPLARLTRVQQVVEPAGAGGGES